MKSYPAIRRVPARLGWLLCLGALLIGRAAPLPATKGPDPIYAKPTPITMSELDRLPVQGVLVREVTDYGPGHYTGRIPNTPPHADGNPHRSFIVRWQDYRQQLVFNHEASYCPWLELPGGMAMCNQFFEGNQGWAELFNQNGRKERNSFVDVIASGPDRAWVRWTYLCVNKESDEQPALRGTEDYIAYPNGLIWRRLKYESLLPDRPTGYSWQPIDFFSVAPAGTTWRDLFPQDPEHHDYLVASVVDLYSDERYDKFWDENDQPRRVGSDELLTRLGHAKGVALVSTTKEGFQFVIFGAASGFAPERGQIVDHSYDTTGGWGWNADRWDHWPIGWLNSQAHKIDADSRYPYHFAPFSHYWVGSPIRDVKPDYQVNTENMELNRWSESHVFYTLTGVAKDFAEIRQLGRKWLDQGEDCATAESIAGLR